MRIVDYMVCKGTLSNITSGNLEFLVREKIKEGWEPIGGAFVIYGFSGSTGKVCGQAMIKREAKS